MQDNLAALRSDFKKIAGDFGMNVGKVLVAVCLCATFALPAVAGVSVNTPTSGTTSGSPVHFVAGAWSNCTKGVAAMGIYTAPGKLAYTVNGAKMDTYLNMGNGTYNVVVQEWDNCNSSTTAPLTLTVGGSSGGGGGKVFSNLQKSGGWTGYALLPPG